MNRPARFLVGALILIMVVLLAAAIFSMRQARNSSLSPQRTQRTFAMLSDGIAIPAPDAVDRLTTPSP